MGFTVNGIPAPSCFPGGSCFFFPQRLRNSGRHFYVVPRSGERGDETPRSRSNSPSPSHRGCGATPSSVSFGSLTNSPMSKFGHIQNKCRTALETFMHHGRGLGRKNIRSLIEDDFGDTPRSKRVANILDVWTVRGATRPITDFYKLEATIGEGACGVVQKWQRKTQSYLEEPYVAVKQIRWSSIWNGRIRQKDQEQLLRNELKMLLVLDHPYIIKFREWFEHPCSGILFVMELCTGCSLQSVLEDICKLPTAEERQANMPRLRRYFREVVYAVSYIHGLNPPVIHRDLKPENVLLQHAGDVGSVTKLVDFGLATLRKHHDGQAFQQGTPVFMAPEQYVSTNGEVTQEMDIWALGVIFTWIITALELGSLQHPMLSMADGEAFDVKWINLYWAYRDERPWNCNLFGGQPKSAYDLCDQILEYRPCGRASALEILEADWVCSGDPSPQAAAVLLSKGRLLRNIETYRNLCDFDKKILGLVAEHTSESQVVLLRRTFQVLDRTKSGKLSPSDLVEGFRSNDVELEAGVLDLIFNSMDLDGSGDIEYHEWLAATISRRTLLSPRAVEAAFVCLNTSGSGSLARSELAWAIGEEEADAILHKHSAVDMEGNVSFRDFSRLLKGVALRRSSICAGDPQLLAAEQAL